MEKINYPILTFILFFISISLILLVLSPKYQAISQIKESVDEWEKAHQDQSEYFKELVSNFEKFKKYESEISKIDLAIPEDPSLPSFFNFVSKSASANGLILKEIRTFDLSLSKEIPGTEEIETSFTISGSYSAFRNFILALERSARMINIKEVSFEAPAGKIIPGAEGLFDFEIKVKFYSH